MNASMTPYVRYCTQQPEKFTETHLDPADDRSTGFLFLLRNLYFLALGYVKGKGQRISNLTLRL